MRTREELIRYCDDIACARGTDSTTQVIEQLLDGDESVRDHVESILDDIDRDLARNGEVEA